MKTAVCVWGGGVSMLWCSQKQTVTAERWVRRLAYTLGRVLPRDYEGMRVCGGWGGGVHSSQ